MNLYGEKILNKLSNSIERLFVEDYFLIKDNDHEISLTHKLSCYLQEEFNEWDVDCEFNRMNSGEKRIPKELNNNKIRPDVIIHKRGKDINLLVVEFKKNSSRLEKYSDICKIINIMKDSKLNYDFGVFINIITSDSKVEMYLLKKDNNKLKDFIKELVFENNELRKIGD